MKLISIVVPMYDEEAGASHFLDVLFAELGKLSNYSFEVVLVNDGSKDKTYEIQLAEQKKHPEIVVVNLTRNFGHESAIAAGLSIAGGEAVIPMDADLQDPPELIGKLLEKYEEGYDVVNARRASREGESAFKKESAKAFYHLMKKSAGKVKVPENVGHFRLISRRALDEVNRLGESVRVFRVEVPFVGFRTTEVSFVRKEREYGKTHYNLESMSKLALDSLVSTTGKPLQLIPKATIAFGAIFVVSALLELILFILSSSGVRVGIGSLGYLSWLIINIVLLLTLAVMCSLSLMSVYLSRLYREAQRRPFYLIESVKRSG